MPHPPFGILEHTADVGIVTHGVSLAELFANAATGMFAIIAGLEGVRQTEERRIEVEARDHEVPVSA